LKHLADSDYFTESDFQFTQPISEIETMIENISKNDKSLMTLNIRATIINPDKSEKSQSGKVYFNHGNLVFLYERIRQKLIEKLLNID